MNRFVQLSIVLAVLASSPIKAEEVALCKPVCAEEKRVCRVAALKMIDHEKRGSFIERHDKNPMAREFGPGSGRNKEPIGPAARAEQNRRMARESVCDDNYQTCAKACVAQTSKPQI